MPQQELLRDLLAALHKAAIPYMLTGSVVSSMQGEPRATHDVDVIVSMEPSDVERVLPFFPPPRYYLDTDDARESIRSSSMFNLLDTEDGGKVDFWMLTGDAFDRSRFGRRIQESVLGIPAFVSCAEDTILAKLRWAKMSGGSEKQFGDALRVYEVQRPHLDLGYLDRWIGELGLAELWRRLLTEAVTD
jgi:hypothetical protein